ncbi:DNA-binding protein [Priestia aryabhattai]|uniref:DNA-binding protein n=1 Tax=Priestia aryabhattai TaxID=412384 RepID=UPI002E1C6C9E|nr:DNA-binding protein [Priestia aryabhattai]
MNMKQPPLSREEMVKVCEDFVVNTTEAAEILEISTSRLRRLVREGKVKSLMKFKTETLFWLPDIEERYQELSGKYNKS